MALPRSHRSAFQRAKNKENRDLGRLGSQNPQNFLACGAASRSPGLEDRNQLFCPNATLYGEPTPHTQKETRIHTQRLSWELINTHQHAASASTLCSRRLLQDVIDDSIDFVWLDFSVSDDSMQNAGAVG